MSARRFSAAVVAAITLLATGAGVARSDELVADSLQTNVAVLDLGSIACGAPASAPVDVYAQRSSGGSAGNVWADSQTLSVTTAVTAVSPAGTPVTAAGTSIPLPSNWGSLANGATANPTPNPTVTVTPTVAGAGSATVTYSTTGTNRSGSNLTRSDVVTVQWNAGTCATPTTTTVTCPASATYTGSAIEPCTAVVTGSGGFSESLPVTYTSNVNSGTATASAAYAGSSTRQASSGSKNFTVTKAPSTVSVSCPASVAWTGSAQTPCSATATGAGGLDATLTPTYADNTNVGTATASATYPGDANHAANSGSKTFTIGKASSTVVVTCPSGVTYTGSAAEPCSARVTGAGGLDSPIPSVGYTNNINAGTATASAGYAGDSTHEASAGSKDFAIQKAPVNVTVTCSVTTVTYDGAAHTPCTAQVTGAGGLNQSLAVSYSDNTTAGTATASASYAGDANHASGTGSASFSITKANSVVTVTCPDSRVYTGNGLTPCTAVVTGPGGLSESLPVTHTNNTNVGTAAASATYAGDANHGSGTGSGSFAITPAASVVTVTCPAAVTYTGDAQEPCTATVTGAGGLNQAATVSYTDNTDAGTAAASASYPGDANHSGSTGGSSFTIGKYTPTVTVICPTTASYTGDAHTCTATVAGIGTDLAGATTDITYGAHGNVNAGEVTVTASYTGTGNYTDASDTESFSIGKAASTVVVSCPDTAQPWTGAAQQPCTAKATRVAASDVTLTPTYSDNTELGTATASASYGGDANHNGSTGSDTFDIVKAPSYVAVNCPTSEEYTGSDIEPCTAKVTGAGGLDETLSVSYENNRNAGDARAYATFPGDAHHLASGGADTFVIFLITKAPSTVTITCPATAVYTGSAIEPCTAKATGAALDLELAVTYTTNTTTGTATAAASYDGDANHTGSANTKTFTITPASSSVAITCPATVTYTGSAQTPCTATATGAGGLTQALTVTYTDNTNAGTATAWATYDGDANHTGSNNSKTFTIDKAASATVITCPATVTYTGEAQEPCTATVTGAGGLNAPVAVTYTTNTNAGTAHAAASYTGDANHTASSDTDTFSIGQADSVTTVSCPTSQVYTGSTLVPCTATATGVGGLNASVAVTYGNNTNVGTANASATYAGDANHTGSTDSKTFEITKATSTVTVSCPTSQVYTGSALTPCSALLTGAGLQATSLTVTHTNNTNVGTANASAAWAGDANHTSSTDSKTFEITKATSTVTVTCTAGPFVYTGAAFTPCSATATGAGGLNVPVAPVSYADNTNAGSASAYATYDGDANHTGSTGDNTFTIAKAPSTVTVTCTAGPFVYTGTAFTPCSAKASGVAMSDLSLTPSYVNNTYPGSATASASWSGDGNHLASSDSATFTIGTWGLKGFYQPVDMSSSGTVLNSVKGGSTVPLKFEIFSGQTELTATSAVKSFTAKQISCQSSALLDDIELTTTGGTSLRYDSTGGQFIQNWQTPKTVGSCIQVTMTAQDNSNLVAYFKIK
ncbi:PxKF domain-containing protein [Terrabacter sp. MAHUQ-38]|uniref:PxKF domain-containing protein n=1 Tax=unclassified Terrabacter TaxID=2630222 RepID=UPI00165E8DB2|nr:PxKF domain-containing protein [Terrabacter sp. MAHUQ-38]MBC9822515.1 PxKF domain-containing protein [Terrabacter sp. MAHUQ-38]